MMRMSTYPNIAGRAPRAASLRSVEGHARQSGGVGAASAEFSDRHQAQKGATTGIRRPARNLAGEGSEYM
jgi:hypothetical protein